MTDNTKTKERKITVYGIITYVIIALVLIIIIFVGLKRDLVSAVNSEYTSICESANTIANSYWLGEDTMSFCNSNKEKTEEVKFKVAAITLTDAEDENEIRDYLREINSDNSDDAEYYFITEDGSIIAPNETSGNTLTDAQMEQLEEDGYLKCIGYGYLCQQLTKGLLIARFPYENYVMISESVSELQMNNTVLIYNKETEEISILPCEDEYEFVKNIDDLGQLKTISSPWKIKNVIEGMEPTFFRTSGGSLNSAFNLCMCVTYDNDASDYKLMVISPIIRCYRESLQNNTVAIIFIVLFAVSSICSALKIRRFWLKGKIKRKTSKIGNNLTLGVNLIPHVLFIQNTVGVFIILVFVVTNMAFTFNHKYDDAKDHLNTLNSVDNYFQSIRENIESDYKNQLKIITDSCVSLLEVKNGEEVNNILNDIGETIGAEKIAVYDETGKIQYSSKGYLGYGLSEDEGNPEYQLWDLLNGNKEYVYFADSDDDSSYYYYAARRTDTVGFVVVKIKSDTMKSILDEYSLINAAAATDFGSSDLMMIDRDNTEILYFSEGGNKAWKVESNTLPVLALEEKTAEFTTVDGEEYFVYGVGRDDYIAYNADLISASVHTHIAGILLRTVFSFVVLTFTVLILTCIIPNRLILAADKNEKEPKKNISELYKNEIVAGIATASIVGTALIYFNYLAAGSNSLLYTLLSGDIKKSLNIMTVTLSLYLLVIVIVINYILGKFIYYVSTKLPVRSRTICEIIRNTISLIIYVGYIIYGLVQFGIDTTTIIGGIGIGSIAVSLGAKDMVADVLAGIALIFDGNIHVGDVITVCTGISDFTGVVKELGLRTTKIEKDNRELSINNSSMVNVINHSRNESPLIIELVIPETIDLENLKKIIADNAERFNAASNNKLKENLYVKGIVGLSGGNMTCQIRSTVDEADKKDALCAVYTELTKLLNENNIITTG